MSKSEFEGKTALITGGASGMGLLSGKNLLELGANVMLADINEQRLNEIKAETNSPKLQTYSLDVRDYSQVSKCCEKTVELFGAIDILITCAGGNEIRLMQKSGEFWELPVEVMDFGLDLNLKGAMYFFHAAMKYMVQRKSGVIICLGSITGVEGSAGGIGYSASKSALMHGVVKSLALCGAKYGIRACCVAPGPVLTRDAMANMKTLIGRAAQPQEIIDLILYLASDKAAFITGTTILADGGRNILVNKG